MSRALFMALGLAGLAGGLIVWMVREDTDTHGVEPGPTMTRSATTGDEQELSAPSTTPLGLVEESASTPDDALRTLDPNQPAITDGTTTLPPGQRFSATSQRTVERPVSSVQRQEVTADQVLPASDEEREEDEEDQ